MDEKKTAIEVAIEGVFNLVQQREIFPGSRLFETDLEETLRVSRTSIRQAFEQLARDGILEKKAGHRGYFFPKLSPEDLHHTFLFREYLEDMSIRLVSYNITPEQECALRCVLSNEENTNQDKVIDVYNDLNNGFHITLARFSGNPYLLKSVKQVYLRLLFYDFFYSTCMYRIEKDSRENQQVTATMIVEHENILNAIVAGETPTAQKLMRQHLRAIPLAKEYVLTSDLWGHWSVKGEWG